MKKRSVKLKLFLIYFAIIFSILLIFNLSAIINAVESNNESLVGYPLDKFDKLSLNEKNKLLLDKKLDSDYKNKYLDTYFKWKFPGTNIKFSGGNYQLILGEGGVVGTEFGFADVSRFKDYKNLKEIEIKDYKINYKFNDGSWFVHDTGWLKEDLSFFLIDKATRLPTSEEGAGGLRWNGKGGFELKSKDIAPEKSPDVKLEHEALLTAGASFSKKLKVDGKDVGVNFGQFYARGKQGYDSTPWLKDKFKDNWEKYDEAAVVRFKDEIKVSDYEDVIKIKGGYIESANAYVTTPHGYIQTSRDQTSAVKLFYGSNIVNLDEKSKYGSFILLSPKENNIDVAIHSVNSFASFVAKLGVNIDKLSMSASGRELKDIQQEAQLKTKVIEAAYFSDGEFRVIADKQDTFIDRTGVRRADVSVGTIINEHSYDIVDGKKEYYALQINRLSDGTGNLFVKRVDEQGKLIEGGALQEFIVAKTPEVESDLRLMIVGDYLSAFKNYQENLKKVEGSGTLITGNELEESKAALEKSRQILNEIRSGNPVKTGEFDAQTQETLNELQKMEELQRQGKLKPTEVPKRPETIQKPLPGYAPPSPKETDPFAE